VADSAAGVAVGASVTTSTVEQRAVRSQRRPLRGEREEHEVSYHHRGTIVIATQPPPLAAAVVVAAWAQRVLLRELPSCHTYVPSCAWSFKPIHDQTERLTLTSTQACSTAVERDARCPSSATQAVSESAQFLEFETSSVYTR